MPGPSTENENAPLLGSRGRSKSRAEPVNDFPDEPEYNQLVKQVETAINRGILPERIYQENFSIILILKSTKFMHPNFEIHVFEKRFREVRGVIL